MRIQATSADTTESSSTPEPTPSSATRSPEPTLEELRRMLEPGWDPTLQWDGTPALTSELTVISPSRPPTV
jgi:hypothetical protein